MDILKQIDIEALFGKVENVYDLLDGTATIHFRKPPKIDKSNVVTFTNNVYCDNVYDGKKAIVKQLPVEEQMDVIKEVVIHGMFYHITKNRAMRAPKPFALFKDDAFFYFFQEQIDGTYIHDLKKDMKNSLLIISSELDRLQKMYNFMHNDFKSDNILYFKNTVYVIDFGMSCFGLECTNKSADICFLLLSIYLNLGRSPKPDFIRKLVNEISLELNTDMPEFCDISEEKDCVCFQDVVYEYKQIDKFVPSEIYKKLKMKIKF